MKGYTRTLIKIGERHGKITLLAKDSSGTNKHPRYRVRCDCGDEYVISGTTFRSSIGCKKCSKGGQPKKYIDLEHTTKSQLYRTWVAMRRRCRDVDGLHGKYWGGKGIIVCREWDSSFENFQEWSLTNGYKLGLTIERDHPDGNYEPSNCLWITKSRNCSRARDYYIQVRRERIDPLFFATIDTPIDALIGFG